MIHAILILGGIGIFFGILLSLVNKKLNIKTNTTESLILEALPGANCGACGFPGCNACCSAIFNKKAPINSCTIGGSETEEKISKILNIKLNKNNEKNYQKKIHIFCKGSIKNAKYLYDYSSISDCNIAKSCFNGPKICNYSCFGLGSCANICPFNAIDIKNGLPIINYKKCTNCGICINKCPQNIIKFVPKKQIVFINCKNLEKAKDVFSYCFVGCIKCKKCEKICKENAIVVKDIAEIDYKKCTNCKECITVCPKNCIGF